MQVHVNQDSFPFPTLFLVASRAVPNSSGLVQPVGTLIAKQTVGAEGDIDLEQQADILMTDVEYPNAMNDSPESYLDLRFESDLVPVKPMLDVVAVRSTSEVGRFGTIRIKRADAPDFGASMPLDYGWRSRQQDPRMGLAGDVAGFEPDPHKPFKLPQNFDDAFFNGGLLPGIPRLQAGDIIEYRHEIIDGDRPLTSQSKLIVPPGPSVRIRAGDQPISPAVAFDLGVDTVVFDFRFDEMASSRFLITWRAVFNWEDRIANLADAVLEVA